MGSNFKRKVLLSTGVITSLAALGGIGAFASFTAQTRNPGNVFADGTLVLSNTKTGGSACLSTGGGTTDVNVNNVCDQLVNLTVKKPGDSGTQTLTVANAGSIAASALKVFEAGCTDSDASAETYHGTGNVCGQLQLYIQQYSDSAFATPSACLYGGATSVTCNFSDTTKTVGAFTTAYNTSTNGLTIGTLAAGASGYFKIGVQLPSTTDNTFQGRQATFDLTWYAVQ